MSTLQVRLRVQLNSIIFAKTLVRKDVASASGPASGAQAENAENADAARADGDDKNEDEAEFGSKAQVMTLMTTDVDRVGAVGRHMFALVESPLEVVVGCRLVVRPLLVVECVLLVGVPPVMLVVVVTVGAARDTAAHAAERVWGTGAA